MSEAGSTFSIAPFIAALLGATVFGWLGAYFGVKGRNFATRQDVELLQHSLKENTEITKRVEQEFARENAIWKDELSYRQQQLSELYGPLYAILKTQTDLYKLWMDKKMRDRNFQVKSLFKEQNAFIRELVTSKAHLIEGYRMPDTFVRFFTSTIIFDMYAAVSDEGEIPKHLSEEPRVAWPIDFVRHVFAVTEKLKQRIGELHARYAPPLAINTSDRVLEDEILKTATT
jgi:hypothetical protein